MHHQIESQGGRHVATSLWCVLSQSIPQEFRTLIPLFAPDGEILPLRCVQRGERLRQWREPLAAIVASQEPLRGKSR